MFRASAIIQAILAGCVPLAAAQLPPLHAAIRNADLNRVEKLIASGADVNEPDAAGTPPLIAAVLSQNLQITRLLLAHGCNVNARQQETHGTALFYAVLGSRGELAGALLSAGALPNLHYTNRQTVLHLAAAKGDLTMARLLLAGGADPHALDNSGNTPLDEAVLHARKDVVELLIQSGADVHAGHGRNGRGPLDEACIAGQPEIALLLIRAGADPALRDNSGQSPLDLALAYKSGSVVSALLRIASFEPAVRQEFVQAMETAVAHGRTAVARLLLDSGWNANERTSAGSSYLNDAALGGHLALSRMLLEHGAKLEARNPQGGTALHDAAIAGNPEIIALLLDHGASIDALDTESGATPLMLAASLGRTSAVSLLLERGANPALADKDGRTALSRAKEAHNSELVKLLENSGKASRKS
ncbi:MAG TPA: ankyrin repeat domain-containing protein [Bryobacteraceae bacterium]|jgi:ankyrin repeat protein